MTSFMQYVNTSPENKNFFKLPKDKQPKNQFLKKDNEKSASKQVMNKIISNLQDIKNNKSK